MATATWAATAAMLVLLATAATAVLASLDREESLARPRFLFRPLAVLVETAVLVVLVETVELVAHGLVTAVTAVLVVPAETVELAELVTRRQVRVFPVARAVLVVMLDLEVPVVLAEMPTAVPTAMVGLAVSAALQVQVGQAAQAVGQQQQT